MLSVFLISFYSCKKEGSTLNYDISARSNSFEDVQSVVDSAERGNIIKIQAGCSTWISTLIIPDDKKITLPGRVKDITIISSGTSEAGSLINMRSSGSHIKSMGFRLSNNNGDGIRVRGTGWRIDLCRSDNDIEQIGRSTDQWLLTDANPYPPQELDPFYQWNNNHNGNDINIYIHNNCNIHIKENGDFYNSIERHGYEPYKYSLSLIESWDNNN